MRLYQLAVGAVDRLELFRHSTDKVFMLDWCPLAEGGEVSVEGGDRGREGWDTLGLDIGLIPSACTNPETIVLPSLT